MPSSRDQRREALVSRRWLLGVGSVALFTAAGCTTSSTPAPSPSPSAPVPPPGTTPEPGPTPTPTADPDPDLDLRAELSADEAGLAARYATVLSAPSGLSGPARALLEGIRDAHASLAADLRADGETADQATQSPTSPPSAAPAQRLAGLRTAELDAAERARTQLEVAVDGELAAVVADLHLRRLLSARALAEVRP